VAADGTVRGKLGILVGGGPAPGINGVIGAATFEAAANGLEVVGIYDGFKWLMTGDEQIVREHATTLTAGDVSQARLRGGSILHTSRANPTEHEGDIEKVVESLQALGIRHLVTIGGDDTAFSALKTSGAAGGAVRVAHVPKTIDNDLPLPAGMPTFGYHTARTVGAELVRGLLEDARTTRRWYIVTLMGRTAGHLALGAGNVAGASLTVIPEEFAEGEMSLDVLARILEGAIVKNDVVGRDYGVAVLAEGLAYLMVEEMKRHPLVVMKKDEHGHWRLAEVPLALIVKRMLDGRPMASRKGWAFVDVAIGYELRCAPPIPYDADYCQELGWGAVRFLLELGEKSYTRGGAMISVQSDQVVPIPFDQIINVKTGKTAVRRVNTASDHYRAARASMIRLEREDVDDPARLAELAAAAGVAPEEFRETYGCAVGL